MKNDLFIWPFYFFSVIKKLDRHAEIDYSLTEPPSFTSKYMDAYLKVSISIWLTFSFLILSAGIEIDLWHEMSLRIFYVMLCAIWSFYKIFKKDGKHPWRSVIFSTAAGLSLQLY